MKLKIKHNTAKKKKKKKKVKHYFHMLYNENLVKGVRLDDTSIPKDIFIFL